MLIASQFKIHIVDDPPLVSTITFSASYNKRRLQQYPPPRRPWPPAAHTPSYPASINPCAYSTRLPGLETVCTPFPSRPLLSSASWTICMKTAIRLTLPTSVCSSCTSTLSSWPGCMFKGWRSFARLGVCPVAQGPIILSTPSGSTGTFRMHSTPLTSPGGTFWPFTNKLLLSPGQMQLTPLPTLKSMNC